MTVEEKPPHTGHTKRRRWPWLIPLAIIAVMALVRLSLNTDLVRKLARQQLVGLANSHLNVRLSVGELKGDLWNEALFRDITVTGRGEDRDTLARIDRLELHYKLLSYFEPRFQLPSIAVEGLFLKVREDKGQWNVARWMVRDTSDAGMSFPFVVDRFTLSGGSIDAVINSLSADSAFAVRKLHIGSRIAMAEEQYDLSISNLSFDLLNTRLEHPVSFKSRFHADGHSLSLQQLVIATGNTLLRSSGTYRMDASAGSLRFEASPLAWKDIAAYAENVPVKQDMQLSVHLSGSPSQFRAGLELDSEGLEQLEAEADFTWDSTLAVTGARLSAARIDLATLLGDTLMPSVNDFRIKADGTLNFNNYPEATAQITWSSGLIRLPYPPYIIDRLEGSFALSGGEADGKMTAVRKDQQIEGSAEIRRIWSEQPVVKARIRGEELNPSLWLGDEQYAGRLSLRGKVSGKGFDFEEPWEYDVTITDAEIYRQPFGEIAMHGTVSKARIVNQSTVRLVGNKVNIQAEVRDYATVPKFSYTLETENFDLSEWRTLENFNSAISLTAKGEGSGASLGALQLTSSVTMDSSVVNGEFVRQLSADIAIDDTVARVKSARLRSTIADGSFAARLHLLRWYDNSNHLNLDLQIKNIESLAPFAGAEEIRARGTLKGELSPVDVNRLKFVAKVNLADVRYNDLFRAGEASGSVEVFVRENPEYIVQMDLVSPAFSSVQFQDVGLQTHGKIGEKRADGNFSLHFVSPTGGEILHSGNYMFQPDTTVITTKAFQVKSPERTLSLANPFEFLLTASAVRMDTMRLASDDGAALELAVPHADSTRQQAYLMGRSLNLAVIQNTLLNRSYFEGVLSGRLQVNNSDTAMTAYGDLTIADVRYRDTKLDSLRMGLQIENMMLDGHLSAIDDGREVVAGELHLPFELGHPSDFGEAFFEKKVKGSFRVKDVALSRFKELLADAGIRETRGNLQMNVLLEGLAGSPELAGRMTLEDATISGVEVDSVVGSLSYVHEQSHVTLSASVSTLKQKAAEIRAEVPFHVDLRGLDVNMPAGDDSIRVDIETRDFNLAALNDFVDRERMRNIKGTINGMVHIIGRVDDLQARGSLALKGGSVRVVPAGITADRINATLNFKPGSLIIETLQARSGSGTLSATGTMAIRKLVPGAVDLSVRAKNFKALNTTDYNAIVDLNTKVTGTLTQPDVKGSMTVRNGYVQLDNFGEKSVENINLESYSQLEAEQYAVYDSLNLAMDLTFERRFYIRNKRFLEMQVELEGTVDLIKEPNKKLQMFGTLRAASGYARPLGKEFELTEGIVTFIGMPENPQLSIRTLYEPPQPKEKIRIWYIIEGTVEEPKFKYESSPPMELENIISYTLFGQPFYALDSWKQVVASSGSNASATDLALEILLDRVEALATRKLGIDVVKIDNTRVGGEAGTSITMGWYINPKVFFAIQNIITGSTPDTGFLLEYSLKENLKLILSQGNDARQGVDLKWNYDY